MKDINIKCDNEKDALFIVKYLIDKGFLLSITIEQLKLFKSIIYPILIYSYGNPTNKYVQWERISEHHIVYDSVGNIEITEAKHIIRQEKLKRING